MYMFEGVNEFLNISLSLLRSLPMRLTVQFQAGWNLLVGTTSRNFHVLLDLDDHHTPLNRHKATRTHFRRIGS